MWSLGLSHHGYLTFDSQFRTCRRLYFFDGDTLADKTVARYLAALAYSGAFLNLHEGPDLCFVADATSVKIYEVAQLDILS